MEKELRTKDAGEPVGSAEVTPEEAPSENILVTEHLQKMPNVLARGLLYIVLLVLVSATSYAVFAKVDIIVEAAGVARPTSHKIRVLSDRDGHIEKVHISEGESVAKEDPLFEIRSKEALTYVTKAEELRRSIPLREDQYRLKVSTVMERLNQLEREYENSLHVNKLKLEQMSLSLDSLESDFAYWRKEADYLSREAENTKVLYDQGILPEIKYNDAKSRLEKAQTERKKIVSAKDIALKEKRIIEGELERKGEDYKSKKELLEKEITGLELEREDTLKAMQNELTMYEKMLSIPAGTSPAAGRGEEPGKIVRAETAGVISELYYRNAGEFVEKSNLLCTIVPAGSPLYMDVTVANKDIGFIEEGMDIRYKFYAFPYTDYGTLSGTVSAISPSAVEDGKGGFVFQVRGTLDKPFFEIAGRDYPIKAGMTATAELVTKRKSLLSFVTEKFKQ